MKKDQYAFSRTAYTDPLAGKGQNYSHEGSEGMTLRDYFAAKALQGILANSHPRIIEITFNGGFQTEVRWAYELADAMLERRVQP